MHPTDCTSFNSHDPPLGGRNDHPSSPTPCYRRGNQFQSPHAWFYVITEWIPTGCQAPPILGVFHISPPILQMKKLRPGNTKLPAQVHTARSKIWTQAQLLSKGCLNLRLVILTSACTSYQLRPVEDGWSHTPSVSQDSRSRLEVRPERSLALLDVKA